MSVVVGRLAAGIRAYKDAYALRLAHTQSPETHWLHSDLTMYQVRQKYEALHPPDEWRLVYFIVIGWGYFSMERITGKKDLNSNCR